MSVAQALLDSSFLYALNSPSDKFHDRAQRVARLNIRQYLIPDVALAEAAYLIGEEEGWEAVDLLLEWIIVSARVQLLPVEKDELARARLIRRQYASANLDLADCCIVALAERLDIPVVCTFDERDFRQFRPKFATLKQDYFRLLPSDM